MSAASALEYLASRELDTKQLIQELLAVRKRESENVVTCALKYVIVDFDTTIEDGKRFITTSVYYKNFEEFETLEEVLEYILRKWW